MLIGIEGGLGSGKTVMMVRYLIKDHNDNKRIITNFHLNEVNYSIIDVEELLNNEDNGLKDCTIGIDELTVFADCRTSSAKMNRLLSYFVLQSRKRSVNVYFTTQYFGMIDARVMHHTNIYVICEKIFKNDEPVEGWRKYTVMDCRNFRKPVVNRFLLDISKYYKYYDTDEIIVPPMLKKNNTKGIVHVDKLM